MQVLNNQSLCYNSDTVRYSSQIGEKLQNNNRPLLCFQKVTYGYYANRIFWKLLCIANYPMVLHLSQILWYQNTSKDRRDLVHSHDTLWRRQGGGGGSAP